MARHPVMRLWCVKDPPATEQTKERNGVPSWGLLPTELGIRMTVSFWVTINAAYTRWLPALSGVEMSGVETTGTTSDLLALTKE